MLFVSVYKLHQLWFITWTPSPKLEDQTFRFRYDLLANEMKFSFEILMKERRKKNRTFPVRVALERGLRIERSDYNRFFWMSNSEKPPLVQALDIWGSVLGPLYPWHRENCMYSIVNTRHIGFRVLLNVIFKHKSSFILRMLRGVSKTTVTIFHFRCILLTK